MPMLVVKQGDDLMPYMVKPCDVVSCEHVATLPAALPTHDMLDNLTIPQIHSMSKALHAKEVCKKGGNDAPKTYLIY